MNFIATHLGSGQLAHGPGRLIVPLLALALMAGEYAYGRINGRKVYDRGETLATLAISVGGRIVNGALAGISYLPLVWVYDHRLATISVTTATGVFALFLAVEFCYYVHHFAMHRVRWFWATHLVHHSASHFNLSAAVRLGWGANILGGVLFYVPLAWIGFSPAGIILMLGAGLVYQFLLHLASAPRLGPLEWVLNTPTHHRVHHALNSGCLDKNFGAVLIVYDRLFGTFAAAPEDEPIRFGLKSGGVSASNPIDVLTAGWRDIISAWRNSVTPGQRFLAAFGKP